MKTFPVGHAGLTAGFVDRPDYYMAPPTGMRSAIPLGGLGSGSFEIRADGSFKEWIIENQSPAGSAKFGTVDDAILGIWTSTSGARMLRTHPPASDGVAYPEIKQMTYSGAFPTSKWIIQDERIPIKASLYAFPNLDFGNSTESAAPAVVFALNVLNPSPSDIDVSLMLSLPIGIQKDSSRATGVSSQHGARSHLSDSADDCASDCGQLSKCQAWTFSGSNLCTLYEGAVPLSLYEFGSASGVKGYWSNNENTLTANRPGNSPASGNISIHGSKFDATYSTSFGTAPSLQQIWSTFSKNGKLNASVSEAPENTHGAVSVMTRLTGGQSKTIVITLGWFFPERNHLDEIVGNFYSNLFRDSVHVVDHVSKRVDKIVDDHVIVQNLFLENSWPEYLQDYTLNSISHLRNAIWTRDGRWRQWEAYDCNDIDSVHNDLQRELPYALFFHDLEMNKMHAWAKGQLPNGMIQEGLGVNTCTEETNTPFDTPGGRVMADVTTGFIIEAYQLWKWTNDVEFIRSIWKNIVHGVQWQISVSAQAGIPTYMVCTYDIINFYQYKLASFNGFMHLTAMMACQALARDMNDDDLLDKCTVALERGRQTMNSQLWTGSYYRAFSGENAVMGDTMYAQVWANTLGLGDTVNQSRQISHLKAEVDHNDTPWGLRVVTGRTGEPSLLDPSPLDNCGALYGPSIDNSIWMGGSQDWSALMLALGQNVPHALSQSEKALNHWRSNLKDIWNTHGIVAGAGYFFDGMPWVTAHYGFHMVLWHIPFALSGQDYSAVNRSLTFDPKLSDSFHVPVLIPNILAMLTYNNNSGVYTLKIAKAAMALHLNHLRVGEHSYPSLPVSLQPGQSISWK
eukprot:TRINITY_DN4283_c0_g1_i3.p1 TRINITY_DN4283_c0_g1~~TRINITY_DN4283_c0_g1_i3.p1  ORF type:complete len:999 (+),score=216.10 TRINITY_DN4283_c0_g1_i3:447-2999(+)